MTGDGAGAELETALSFLAELDDAVAGEVVSLGWGTGVFDRRRPLVWDANYMRVAPAAELSATELAEVGEPLFSERGLAHRSFVFSDTHQAERLAGEFARMGWETAHEVVMVSRRPPAAPVHQVAEISVQSYEESKRAFGLAEPPGGIDPAAAAELAADLASRDALIREVASERRFGIFVDRRVVSACVLVFDSGDRSGRVGDHRLRAQEPGTGERSSRRRWARPWSAGTSSPSWSPWWTTGRGRCIAGSASKRWGWSIDSASHPPASGEARSRSICWPGAGCGPGSRPYFQSQPGAMAG